MPRVSVIIPCYGSQSTIPECLTSLSRQTYPDFEVILCDSSPDPAPTRRVVAAFSGVRLLRSERRLLPHAARNLGAAESLGEILVFTDPDCRADADWIERLVAAHDEGHPVVGGAVAGLPDFRNRSIHMVKYGWWLPGGRPGPREQLPSASLSLSRELWQRVGPFRPERWSGDADLSRRLRDVGETLWFDPRARTTHLDHGPFRRFLRQHGSRGYDFGLTRAERRGWRRGHCLARALGSPLVPVVMAARVGRRAAEAGALDDWVLTLPWSLAALTAWALGEAAALLRIASRV